MRISTKIIIFSILFLNLFIISKTASSTSTIFRIGDSKIISFEEMMNDIKKARIIIIGENHDNMSHHDFQLQVIETLHNKRIPIALGLEMFRTESQKKLDGWVKGTLSLQDFLRLYYDNWGFSWPLYRDIFIYARDKKIPMVGLNLPRTITQKIAQSGFSSLTEEELKVLPPGIACDITSSYKEYIRRAYRGHGFENEKLFVHFCEAQMVWDSAMAWNIMQYIKQNTARLMVVLTGSVHAWKMGIPSNLKRDPMFSSIVIIPEKPNELDKNNATIKEADYLITPLEDLHSSNGVDK